MQHGPGVQVTSETDKTQIGLFDMGKPLGSVIDFGPTSKSHCELSGLDTECHLYVRDDYLIKLIFALDDGKHIPLLATLKSGLSDSPEGKESGNFQVKNGRMVGTYTFSNGNTYQGDFMNGSFGGTGLLTNNDNIIITAYLNGLPSFLHEGDMYRDGTGVLSDYEKAFGLYKKATISTESRQLAMGRIAQMYLDGQIIIPENAGSKILSLSSDADERTKELIEGYAWANAAGDDLRSAIEQELSAAQVLKAQKRSKELIVEIEKGVNSATLPEPPKLSDDTITHLKLIETTLLSIAGVNPEGVASSDAMNAQPLRNVKTECAGLGFKPKTEKFADCMLQLTE
jgi:hypothetical protein